MDFFTSQERARRNTTLLVFFYLLAVALIILAVYGIFAFALLGAQPQEPGAGFDIPLAQRIWNPELFMWVVGITIFIVAIGTVTKIAQLSAGGQSVATMLGGRKIEQQTNDLDERKILNIVEEMSIASGVPTPPVFILDNEMSINAFAAGFSTRDAVIGVTRGCVQQLSRDELQGVVAHEFSHMINGDMRLNIKMIGLLNGILIIALVGYWAMCLSNRSRNSKDNNMPIVLIGLLLMIVGYIGVFFGNIIKAAVSRQREFNADAAAVQFTRNPDGIAGALKKIGGYAYGSKIEASNAEEVSHMLFSSGVSGFLAGLFATHPPLEERIKRLDGSFTAPNQTEGIESGTHSAVSGFSGSNSGKLHLSPGQTAALVGTPTQLNVDFATEMLRKIPRNLTSAASNNDSARSVIFALMLDEDKNSETRKKQESWLKNNVDDSLFAGVLAAADETAMLWQGYRLPLANMAVAALKGMAQSQYDQFISVINFLVLADQKIDLFEYMISRLVKTYLDPNVKNSIAIKSCSKSQALLPLTNLISCLAFWGTDDDNVAKQAFMSGMERFAAGSQILMPPRAQCTLAMLDDAINSFVHVAPRLKRTVIESCIAAVAADNFVTIEEAELLRAVSAALDCPMPPFISGDIELPVAQ